MEKYEKIWAEKCVSDIARAGDKVDETAYFKQLTTGLMPELPADEKITRALRDPEFDYVPQNAYDRLKLLEPAVEKFFPNQRFLQGVNVNVNEFGRHGVCPREEYDLYKAERDRQAAKEAAARGNGARTAGFDARRGGAAKFRLAGIERLSAQPVRRCGSRGSG